jgi:hypothetical protein
VKGGRPKMIKRTAAEEKKRRAREKYIAEQKKMRDM